MNKTYAPIRGDKHVTFEVDAGQIFLRFRVLRAGRWVYVTPRLKVFGEALNLVEPWEGSWTEKGGGHAEIRRRDRHTIDIFLNGEAWADSTNLLWGMGMERLKVLIGED